MTSVSLSSEQLIQTFNKDLEQILVRITSAETAEDYESALGEGATKLSTSIIEIGKESALRLKNLPKKATKQEILPASIISYLWAADAKSFMLLWRDVLIQQQKAKIMQLDGKVTKAALLKLRQDSKEVLRDAAAEFKACFEDERKFLSTDTKENQRVLNKWSQQHNPWAIYEPQIEQLAKQCREAEVLQNGLQNTTTGFQEIKELIHQTIDSCQEELLFIRRTADKTMGYIEEDIESKPGTVATHLEGLEDEINIPAHFKNFTAALKDKISNLAAKMQVPIDTNGGMVQIKETNFKKNAQQWLDSEVVPILYEIWEITEAAEHSMKMSLVNIRNRAILLSNELKEGKEGTFKKDYYCQPLEAFVKKLDKWGEDIKELEQIIDQRLEESFYVSAIYDAQKSFLPISLQSTLTQFTSGQNKLLEQARTHLTKPTSFIKHFRDTVSEEENLSAAEKIVRTIEDRGFDPKNVQYTSIFQTKGYIGESFWVGRESEFQRVERLIEQWELGYRGSVIVSGERFSGKSLFGDIIANKYFPKRIIRLEPNTHINTDGRKWTTSYDLKEALTYVKNKARQSRSLIWLDDMELWQSPTISLSQNVRSLLEHIDTHSTQFFYMITMSKWLKNHLNKTNVFDKSFQASILLDKMSYEEIQQAILIRHGATHKVLVDEEKEEVSSEAFSKMTTSIYKSSQKNIGDALNRWAASIYQVDTEEVIFKNLGDYQLPDFLNPDSALLLSTIIKEKRTNEYRLRQLFGIAFKEKYSNILQRLISMGILKRELDGMLKIDEKIVNEVGRLLERKKYL